MFLSSFSYDSLTLGEALKKPHRSQDFLFSSLWLPNTGKQGMQTWCKHFFIFLHNTSDFLFTILPIYCFSLLPGFQDSFWWKQRKKTVNTTNLRQPRRLLMLNFLKDFVPPLLLLPTDLHFHISVLCVFFLSKWKLVTQIVAFLYVAYKQRQVSISAYPNFLLNNDLNQFGTVGWLAKTWS